jgi:peptidyl-prolyl cis-trans isomerase A (cyclophilin A)
MFCRGYAAPVIRVVAAAALCAAVVTAGAGAAPPQLLAPGSLHATAPASYRVAFTTTKGRFVVTVHRSWAPRGADRFYNLVRAGFYDGITFFRVLRGFVVQFGISGDPAVAKAWQTAQIPDDPVKTSNTPATITFATAGPNTRTTQVFLNLGANAALDAQGFAPFGRVTSGMGVVGRLYGGYGDQPAKQQQQIVEQGNAFLRKTYPKLDHIVTARVVR